MKLTGRLLDDGLSSFTEKSSLRNGQRVPRIWILAADHHLARIYQRTNNHVELIGEVEPEILKVKTEINNKTMGRMVSSSGSRAGSGVRHKFDPRMNESRQEELAFARNISKFLEKTETADVFDKLVVIASPKMLGDLRANFSKLLKSRIVAEVDKNLTKLNDKEFEKALEKIAWF